MVPSVAPCVPGLIVPVAGVDDAPMTVEDPTVCAEAVVETKNATAKSAVAASRASRVVRAVRDNRFI
jgi:hypothetical protein